MLFYKHHLARKAETCMNAPSYHKDSIYPNLWSQGGRGGGGVVRQYFNFYNVHRNIWRLKKILSNIYFQCGLKFIHTINLLLRTRLGPQIGFLIYLECSRQFVIHLLKRFSLSNGYTGNSSQV